MQGIIQERHSLLQW